MYDSEMHKYLWTMSGNSTIDSTIVSNASFIALHDDSKARAKRDTARVADGAQNRLLVHMGIPPVTRTGRTVFRGILHHGNIVYHNIDTKH